MVSSIRAGVLRGSEWIVRAREAELGETPDVEGIDMLSLLDMIPGGEVDLLKIDIERSEIMVFGHGTEAWLPRVRNITIELHDEQCETIFTKALEPYRYIASKLGELTFCQDIRPNSDWESRT